MASHLRKKGVEVQEDAGELYRHHGVSEVSADMGFIGWIIVGLAAGWLAGLITGTKDSRGLIGNLILGLVGAFVAGLLTNNLVGGNAGLITSIVVAAAVAAILVVIKGAITGSRT